MKTILYMAISADGFIAGEQDETPWSDDSWQVFKAFRKILRHRFAWPPHLRDNGNKDVA